MYWTVTSNAIDTQPCTSSLKKRNLNSCETYVAPRLATTAIISLSFQYKIFDNTLFLNQSDVLFTHFVTL